MINFKKLTLRNFLSYGNNITEINLDFSNPTLIVGKNFDSMSNGQIDSNGSGKTAILNAICFCVYDQTISKIEKNDLVNYINDKNMEVSITFSKNNINYKIERYRKNKIKGGDGVRLFINETSDVFNDEHDKTPDSVSNTNKEIEKIIGIPFDIFSRIVVFSASYEPFLSLPSSHASKSNQRDIIEELFGLTELTRKAEVLKENISLNTKDLSSILQNNNRIISEIERYTKQIDSTKIKQKEWNDKQLESIQSTKLLLDKLMSIKINEIETILSELSLLNNEQIANTNKLLLCENNIKNIENNVVKYNQWNNNTQENIQNLKTKLQSVSKYNFDELELILTKKKEIQAKIEQKNSEYKSKKNNLNKVSDLIVKIKSEISQLEKSICPFCNQNYAEAKIKLEQKQQELIDSNVLYDEYESEIEILLQDTNNLSNELDELNQTDIPENLALLKQNKIKWNNELDNLEKAINPFDCNDNNLNDIKNEKNKLDAVLREILKSIENINIKLNQYYNPINSNVKWTSDIVSQIKSQISQYANKLNNLNNDINPYTSLITELQFTLDNEIDKPNIEESNKLNDFIEHQQFLLKLLTKKDSFVRKALLNKNIPFLNGRLSYYLDTMGLSHKVSFSQEMGVNITQFGTEYNYENLSAGQKARVNLALSFAFRDVLQMRFGKINFCILDECLDVGLGNVGVQQAAKLIKTIAINDKLSMFVISHRDEISSMFSDKLEIHLKNGFSNLSTYEEV